MRTLAGVIVGVALLGGSCNLEQAEKAVTLTSDYMMELVNVKEKLTGEKSVMN